MVYLAMHLCQLGSKISPDLLEDGFEPVESIGVKDLFPVPSQEDQMDMKLKDAIPAVPNLSWRDRRPNDTIRLL